MIEFKKEDEMERFLFTHLTTAIVTSYEKEKVYSNIIRIWSYVSSIISECDSNAVYRLPEQYTNNIS